MGHKVHPLGFRLGVIYNWQAKWYADKHYAGFLQEDLKLRKAIQFKYADAAISSVEIERQSNQVAVTIHTSRPGIVIGRGGQRVEELRHYLEQMIGKRIQINIREIPQPELDAYLVARAIAEQMERRVAYRRAMKQATLRTLQAGAKGIRIACAGRLGGAEIARRLTIHEGQVPLQTLRADIDYGFIEARTVMGRIGVKVWIYKGEIIPKPKVKESETAAESTTKISTEAILAVESAVKASPEATPAAELASKPTKVVRKRRTKVTPPPEEIPVKPVEEAKVKETYPIASEESNVTT